MLKKKLIAFVLITSFIGSTSVEPININQVRKYAPVAIIGSGLCLAIFGAIILNISSNTKSFKFDGEGVEFEDIKGIDNVVLEAKEYLDIAKDSRYKKLGAIPPRGIILYGPPGCGKTLIAKAMAGYSGCKFISISGSEFVKEHAGSGAARVRGFFESGRETARSGKPTVLFIDEIDSIGTRTNAKDGGSPEYNNTINEILVQMDGVKDNRNLIIVAATNNILGVDSALLRPGRFDRKIKVSFPDQEGRKEIIKLYLEKIKLCKDLDVEEVANLFADKTSSFSPADLKHFVNESAIIAGRNNSKFVSLKDLEDGLIKSLDKFTSTIKDKYSSFMKEDFKINFNDVRGYKESLIEVRELVDMMVDKDRYSSLGAKRPRGLILYGPPGCGKTLIAKAIAGEGDAHIIAVSGSEFVEVYVGSGAKNIRELFSSARKIAKRKPVIIFIDEIDSLGARTSDIGGGRTYNEAINELLVQMDGFNTSENILVIAATNRLSLIDPALLRPGRFDRKVLIPLPNKLSREEILKLYLSKINLCKSNKIEEVAKIYAEKTEGFSGSELRNLINEAAILAGRYKDESVNIKHIDESLERNDFGLICKEKKLKE